MLSFRGASCTMYDAARLARFGDLQPVINFIVWVGENELAQRCPLYRDSPILKGLPCGGIPEVIFIVWVGEVNLIRKKQNKQKHM